MLLAVVAQLQLHAYGEVMRSSSKISSREWFENLLAVDDPGSRGREFEKLLASKLREESGIVVTNARAATPRQTDLMARLDSVDLLIEAKWLERRIDVSKIDDLRSRLGRTASDIVGCIFSMSDFADSAVDAVEGDRTREILLFNPAEVNAIFHNRLAISDLVKLKRRKLRVHARVWFSPMGTKTTGKKPRWPLPEEQIFVGDKAAASLLSKTDEEEVVFSRQLLFFPSVAMG